MNSVLGTSSAAVAGRRFRVWPLASFTQESFWLFEQLHPGTGAYNERWGLRLHGALDKDALRGALGDLSARHEALRTTLALHGGELVQVTGYPQVPDLAEANFAGLTEEDRREAFADWSRRIVSTPFDMTKGPLFRWGLATLGPGEQMLVCCAHHSVIDGWSVGILMADLSVFYTARLSGELPGIAGRSRQFREASEAQRTRLSADVIDSQLEYWRARLSGAPSHTDLPADRQRPAASSHRGGSLPVRLPDDICTAAAEFARREGTTLFTVLFAAFNATLSRLAGAEDLVVGTSTASRAGSEDENVVGCFANTLAVRSDLSGGPSLRQLVSRTRDTLLGAYENADVPFEKLVECLASGRDRRYAPLFNTFFALINVPDAQMRFAGLRSELTDLPGSSTKFDLTVALREGGSALEGTVEFSADLFDESTADRYFQCFATLLAAALTEPDRSLAAIDLVPRQDQLLIEAINDTSVLVPGRRFDELVAGQAAAHPAAVAVEFADGDGVIRQSYREIDQQADGLAAELRLRGIRCGDRVLVHVRSLRYLPLAALAIWKASGVYVPVDPSAPAARLAAITAAAAPTAVICDTDVPAGLLTDRTNEVRIDTALSGQPASPTPGSAAVLGPDDPAYMIFTSGSTGDPKGVVIAHRGLTNLALAQQLVFHPGPGDRVLQFSSPSFDASIAEMTMALANGATLCCAPRERLMPGEPLAEFLDSQRISHAVLVPSALAELPESRYPFLRLLGSAGEQCPLAIGARFSRGRRFYNLYGPTECSVWSTYQQFDDQPDDGPSTHLLRMPIGRPVANTTVHVLDQRRMPVPVGVPGELYIGGAALAVGYLDRPDLTAERFTEGQAPAQARLYRTGDLVRQLPDGSLEFLGRLDHQVKLRGFRIELEEIETWLRRAPGILHAIAFLDDRRDSNAELVAAVAGDVAPVDLDAARALLKASLPDYMVPSRLVALAEMPMTLSGKPDRAAVREQVSADHPAVSPAASALADTGQFATALEEGLAAIVTQVLGVPSIGPLDDFFDLGGHSLSATRLMARIRAQYRTDVPLGAFFANPTVRSLSALIQADRSEAAAQSAGMPPVPRIPRAPDAERTQLTPGQERLYFLYRMFPDSAAYHIPVRFRLTGSLDIEALRMALRQLLARHEPLRTVFRQAGDEARAHILPSPPDILRVIDARESCPGAPGRPLADVAREEATLPFDLANTGPVRALLARTSHREHTLFLTLHHIACDGWSLNVLFREFGELYRAAATGAEPGLERIETHYGDVMAWRRAWVLPAVRDRQLSFWRETLRGAPRTLSLPADLPRPPVTTHAGDHLSARVAATAVTALRALAKETDATMFMVLHAAFAGLLGHFAGQRDLVIGTPVASRGEPESDPLVGLFVNTLPLRLRWDCDPSLRELLVGAKNADLAAFEHQDVPFEAIVEAMGPARDASRTPLFQAMLALQNTPPWSLELDGLNVVMQANNPSAAKFDLTLSGWELTDGGLDLMLTYRTDVFTTAAAETILGALVLLLEAAADRPDVPVAELLRPSLSNALLGASPWQPAMPKPFVPELVALHARRRGTQYAIEGQSGRLTYAELDLVSAGLAQWLENEHGVRAGTVAAVATGRTPDLAIAALALWRLGAVYVPVDTSAPASRVHYMLTDCAASILLATEEESPPTAAVPAGVRTVTLRADASWRQPGIGAGQAANERLTSATPAYCMYTSGSTGRPKGIIVGHGSLAQLAACQPEAFGLTPESRVLQFASPGFDASISDLIMTLAAGATACFPRPGVLVGAALTAAVADASATHVKLPPSAVLEIPPSAAKPIDVLIVGGEVLTPRVLRHARAIATTVINVYGVTEAGARSFSWQDDRRRALPAIGASLPGVAAWILDSRLRPLPSGVPGELCLAGPGLAIGYTIAAAGSSERFCDLRTGDQTVRVYRTGDKVVRDPDGLLRYLGRMDDQIQLHGVRIEPGEIESALAELPEVERSVVVRRDDGPGGDPALAAYIVPARDAVPRPDTIRAALRQSLAEAMVPVHIVFLRALPLNQSGKVDRGLLPRPAAPISAGTQHPLTRVEAKLAGIWAEVLGVDQVGAEDNFFDLGGSSLLLGRVHSRLRREFAADISLVDLFTLPTVRSIADRLTNNGLRPERPHRREHPRRPVRETRRRSQ